MTEHTITLSNGTTYYYVADNDKAMGLRLSGAASAFNRIAAQIEKLTGNKRNAGIALAIEASDICRHDSFTFG